MKMRFFFPFVFFILNDCKSIEYITDEIIIAVDTVNERLTSRLLGETLPNDSAASRYSVLNTFADSWLNSSGFHSQWPVRDHIICHDLCFQDIYRMLY